MSNFLAIATVTATLKNILQSAVDLDVDGATVTTLRPDNAEGAMPNGRGINVYLYQVTPNAAWRNADLPTRNPNGRLAQRPRVALDLHYLLTYYGDEPTLEPQRLLGVAERTLHTQPVLTPGMIEGTVTDASTIFLADSDLADEIERVKFAPIPLTLEELSKLWSVFFQTAYALSTAYVASVVLIESEVSLPSPLPVRARNFYALPFQQPIIEAVVSEVGDSEPILSNGTLLIRGKRLRGDVTRVRIAGIEVEPDPADVTDTQIRLPLTRPAALRNALRAGVQGVQVIHQLAIGTPPTPHQGVESNIAPFVLRPRIARVSVENVQDLGDNLRAADMEVTIRPAVGQEQRVVLFLNEFRAPNTRPSQMYRFDAPRRDGPTDPETTDVITFQVTNVIEDQYLVRLQVDGAESPLGVNTNEASPTFNEYVRPRAGITL